MKEAFHERLFRIRNKFAATQDEIAPHYGVKLGIYQRYESGKNVPEKTALRKWMLRMDELEKLQTLPPLSNEKIENTSDKDRMIANLEKQLQTEKENFTILMGLYERLVGDYDVLKDFITSPQAKITSQKKFHS